MNHKYCLFHDFLLIFCLVISPFHTTYRSSAVTPMYHFQATTPAPLERERIQQRIQHFSNSNQPAGKRPQNQSEVSEQRGCKPRTRDLWFSFPSRVSSFAPPEARSVFLTDHTEKSSVGIITTSTIKISTMATSLPHLYLFLLSDRHCKSPSNNNHKAFQPCHDQYPP